jgi:hypothetical protein
LSRRTGTTPPESLLSVESAEVRFSRVVSPADMPDEIVRFASRP